jgi:hypothetical protein
MPEAQKVSIILRAGQAGSFLLEIRSREPKDTDLIQVIISGCRMNIVASL